MEAAYHACIRLRAAVRILHLLGEGTMKPDQGSGFDELYAIVRKAAAWETMLAPGLDVQRGRAHAKAARAGITRAWRRRAYRRRSMTLCATAGAPHTACMPMLLPIDQLR